MFNGKRHPRDLGAGDVERLLSDLAVRRQVSASTLNQIKSALLFRYRKARGTERPRLDDVVRHMSIGSCGCRAQVQQVFTVSRVANNLALAVSLAGSAPGSGIAANAAANYSRQSISRAAALERVPSLVGYSLGDTFGWVVGPKATLDPKGTLSLEQTPRTLDLSVDLSIPAWWPSLTIETVTAWAPRRETNTSGSVALAASRSSAMRVPMEANYADYAGMTSRIMHGDLGEAREVLLNTTSLGQQSVSAYRATSIFLSKPNIWRAGNVLIEGYRLDQAAITVSPEIDGVLVNVPALDESLGDVATAEANSRHDALWR